MLNLFVNLRYLLAPTLILISLAGVIVGGIFSWTGVILLFVGILIDTAIYIGIGLYFEGVEEFGNDFWR